MTGDIWVVSEAWRGQVSEISYEVLALGRELADALGVPLRAVLLGHGIRHLSACLGKADSVLYADDPQLAELSPAVHGEALAQLARQRTPKAVLIPLTNISLGVGSFLGVRLGTGAVNFCVDAKAADGRLQAECILYGGKIQATVAIRAEPAVMGIWPGSRPQEQGRAAQAPPVEDVPVALAAPAGSRLVRYLEPEAGDVDISQQPVLVAVGRGIQSQDNLSLAEELAQALGGAVCGSRPVIDQGWLPLSRQVGKSGLTVKPKLYLALGISGAPEHVEGMRKAGLIVAVNTDANAPIFNVAHYGIVADALDMLPALTQAAHARKG